MSSTRGDTEVDGPELPTGRVVLRPPPEVQPGDGAGGALMNAIPMLGSLGSIALVATTAGRQGADATRSYLAAGLFLLATLGFVVVQLDRQHRRRTQQAQAARAGYLRHLADVRRVVRQAAVQQRRALTWRHPGPASLPALAAEGSRVWEHGRADSGGADVLPVRYGTCAQPLSTELVPPPGPPGERVDPVCAVALRRLIAVHGVQPDLPLTLDLRTVDRVELRGEEGPVRGLARAMVCSATAFHSPEQLVVAVLAHERHLLHWDWVKWLPHAQSPCESDAVGPRRLVATSREDLAALLPDPHATASHLLLVADGVALPPDGPAGVTVLDLPPQRDERDEPAGLRLELTGAVVRDRVGLRVVRTREQPVPALGDQCDLATAEAFARRLTPIHTVAAADSAGTGGRAGGPRDLPDLLGLGDVHAFDPSTGWRPRPARDRLRVPIGLGEDGVPVHLDLKESAQQGMGPHGLVVGATGSGKSELLRTLVLGLAMTHSPEQLTLVLVDFKGGATFAGMSRLPHVSAVITNLAQELTLVDRMQDALSGEMVRRQQLLREAGDLASVRDYEEARAAGAPLPPLPSLLIVVDEFSEMLSAKPEFLDLFVAIGRLGRSLGLHLLLASQRLEEGRLRGLESHLSYRVGLRTFSAAESRAVLGAADAYELPPVPGLGYLKPDPTTLQRFTAAYVSGPPGCQAPERRDEARAARGILPFTISAVPAPGPAEPQQEAAPTSPSSGERPCVLDVAVDRMTGHGPLAHQVWLPPLDVPDTLDSLLGDLAVDPRLGLVSARWRGLPGLTVPLGTVDRPREQRRDILSVDLSGAAGHVAVVGGPRSGKSTLLRTAVASLSLTTTPRESQFFVLDFGGGSFAPWARLPHVAGVGTRSEPEVVRRVVAEVRGIVERREAYFRDHRIDSIETYRSRRAQGDADDGYGDVFLVVDGWSTLRADFDDLETEVQQLSARGLTFGLHLLTAASRWADFRAATRDVLGTRLELRLGDAMDSEIDRQLARLVPTGRPGRGLVPGGLHFLGALPRVDGDPLPDSLGAGVDDLVTRAAEAWPGPAGPRLRLLPEQIGLDTVRDQAVGAAAGTGRLLLGVDERELAPVGLDVSAEPHLLVLGDGGSGKTGVLRTYLREVIRTRTPQRAQVVLVDYRRSLLGEVPEEYLLDHLTSTAHAGPVLRDLATHLERRLPGPDVTAEQLRTRSWWSGAEVFVVVDDYDLVATQQGSPVAALQPLLAQAGDTGLHLVVARRSGGASRALYEPVLQTLRDLAAPALLLAGNPDEGPLIGSLRPVPGPAGRGRLVTRDRGTDTVQAAWTDPAL